MSDPPEQPQKISDFDQFTGKILCVFQITV